MEKKKSLTEQEINTFLDNYFAKLESDIMAVVNTQIKAETKLFTADAVMLVFPDEIDNASRIEKGTGPVKLEDGRLAVGDFTMPDGTKFTTDAKGIVIKVTHPTPDEIAAKIRADMAAFKKEIRALVVRKPFKESDCK
ncbi:MAG: hypothetical protein GX646_06460 [Bacteroidales bacterium]|nr:hypothetical protein [Bacteroidales bacterium]